MPALKPGDEFYQEVVVGRVSRYRVLGADLGQDVRYALVSRFRVERRTPGGGLVLRQKVQGVRLARADRGLQERLNGLLAKVRGSSFTITLDGKGRVSGFDGTDEALKVLTAPGPLGGQAFLLWSFLDRDGWKELAQRSLFRPPGPPRPGQSWAEPMTHSWGPLGLWSGRAVHRYAGRKGGLDHYRYALELAYRPPPAGARGLPFLIEKPDFRVEGAAGEIAFDPARGRVAAFEERFHVRGSLAVSAPGVLTPVALDERQVFRVRILDEDPLREPARR